MDKYIKFDTDSNKTVAPGRSRNNVDTRLIGFPPRTEFTPHRDAGMRGGNDIAILHHLYRPAPVGPGDSLRSNAGTGAKRPVI